AAERLDSFRLLTGGLTRRALLLAIMLETLRLGWYLRTAPAGWERTLLLDILSFRAPGDTGIWCSRLADVAVYFDCTSRRGYHAAQNTLKALDDALGLELIDSGNLKEDILLAMLFLKFIYCEADWSKELPDPNLNAQSCRDRQFMVTYLQVGLYAPLLVRPVRSRPRVPPASGPQPVGPGHECDAGGGSGLPGQATTGRAEASQPALSH
ncbi:hypothetical protein, partial [Thermaurantiacus sp.]